jgi:hypothetical protein
MGDGREAGGATRELTSPGLCSPPATPAVGRSLSGARFGHCAVRAVRSLARAAAALRC